ncbi:hypothetical protein PLEOSDRAFT_1082887 [Pleurotus ostreatus PC15]|uniref:Uncharacterized protein n=1 Tax=Pleurotus ostreatus (strain PC15) TaxID=1137138 RepID=A0A067NZC9_PLEO1|nr:hypothetical protein PLEOSDRAFT_1082887 [Pleurotus ostreatus PC15]
MPPQPSLGALPLPAPPSLPPQPVPRTQTSPTPDPRRRLSAGSLARQAGRSDSRRTENSEEVRVKQEELQAAVQEYQARQTRDSSTLTNHDGAPRSQSIVKEELDDLVAEYLARVKQEVKQEGCGDRWIKEENDEDERSTTAVTGGSESRERKHDRRSGTLSMSPSRFTEDSESHVVKQEEKDFSWLKQEEDDLTERSSMTASVAPDRGWFKRGGRYEGTIPRQPKRLAEVQDPRLLKRIKSEPR